MMIESRRRAYLDALGFDVWCTRPPAPDFDRFLLQAGEGDTLLVCDQPCDLENPLVSDITRALAGAAVWAWPDPEGRVESLSLGEAVAQCLATRVVVFGSGLIQQIFKGEAPLVVGSARILSAPRINDLAVDGSAKRVLWKELNGLPETLL